MFADGRDWGAFISAELDDFGLDMASYRIYAHICRRAGSGECWEGIDRMAEICKMNRKTAYKALSLLEKHRLIKVERRTGKSNLVTLTPQREWIPLEEEITRTKSGTPNDLSQIRDTPTPIPDQGHHLSQIRDTTYPKLGTPPVPDQVHKGNPSKEIPKGYPSKCASRSHETEIREEVQSDPEPEAIDAELIDDQIGNQPVSEWRNGSDGAIVPAAGDRTKNSEMSDGQRMASRYSSEQYPWRFCSRDQRRAFSEFLANQGRRKGEAMVKARSIAERQINNANYADPDTVVHAQVLSQWGLFIEGLSTATTLKEAVGGTSISPALRAVFEQRLARINQEREQQCS